MCRNGIFHFTLEAKNSGRFSMQNATGMTKIMRFAGKAALFN
jgi:hypothetical protein